MGDAAHTKVVSQFHRIYYEHSTVLTTLPQPNSSQGTAMCIEDAATLGALFSRIQAEEEVRMILHAYEAL